jgi:hypothetical protein
MKKIFLICAIAAGSTSAAQQADLFDTQEYLKKRSFDQKNATINNFYGQKNTGSILPKAPFTTLQNGDVIYYLPQDNMPCVVTDLNAFNMPNAASSVKDEWAYLLKPGNAPGKMPNAAPPSWRNYFQSK